MLLPSFSLMRGTWSFDMFAVVQVWDGESRRVILALWDLGVAVSACPVFSVVSLSRVLCDFSRDVRHKQVLASAMVLGCAFSGQRTSGTRQSSAEARRQPLQVEVPGSRHRTPGMTQIVSATSIET